MHSVHPVFHVSMLKPATSNTFSERIQPAPALVIIDGEPEYEISRIVDSKINHQRTCKLLYKVIWLGYEDTGDESEWIPISELTHTVDLVSDFHIAYPTKPSPLLLSWTHCCICSLSLCISNGDFPSLISSIFCPLILINPQLPCTFQGFLFKLQTSFHFNSCLFLLTYLIHRKKLSLLKRKNKTSILTGGRRRSSPLLTFSRAILGPLLFISILLLTLFF